VAKNKRIIILGGGVAGMSAAHELIARKFDVEVFERQPLAGGKARSLPVPGSATGGRKPLPGEHGFRFFPGFYSHLFDTLKRISYTNNKRGVFDNLVPATQIGFARFGKPALVLRTQVPWTLNGLKEIIRSITAADLDIPDGQAEFFAERAWQLMTSCTERRLAEYEQLSWWEFLEADSKSEDYVKFFVRGLTRSLVAARAEAASTYTIGDIFLQLFFDLLNTDRDVDKLLDGPTNEVWIDPWLKYLTGAGVKYHLGAKVVKINSAGGKIASVTIEENGKRFEARGDYYIAALPVEVMAGLITEEMLRIDSTLEHLKNLGSHVEWMNGLQIYLRRDIKLVHGHLSYVDSPWALTSVSQRQFWSDDFDFDEHGDGAVQGIISVDISDWNSKGLHGRSARESTKEQIFQEVWDQLKKSLNVNGQEILKDEDLHSYHLDPDIVFMNGQDDPDPAKKINEEPLLVNLVNTWGLRPEAYTRVPNLFLASDYVRTNTDLACMEAANEAARRAVNCIIDASGSRSRPCKIWAVKEPALFEFWRKHDGDRFAKGLPWLEKFSFAVFFSIRFWYYFLKHLYLRVRVKIHRWKLSD
jgi:uncharacterized protein with NAD-binding domain and iron-sulfur cluster